MKMTTKISLLGAAFCMIGLSAWAVNEGFMSNTAMSYFTKQDWEIFNQTQLKALNNTRDGVKVTWSNPSSGASGYMIPSGTTQQKGMQCRHLTFYNLANQVKGEGTYLFCKNNGKWMIY